MTSSQDTAHPMNKGSDAPLREQVRDFIYDATRDEFQVGWTLSAQQADDLVEMISRALTKVEE